MKGYKEKNEEWNGGAGWKEEGAKGELSSHGTCHITNRGVQPARSCFFFLRERNVSYIIYDIYKIIVLMTIAPIKGWLF